MPGRSTERELQDKVELLQARVARVEADLREKVRELSFIHGITDFAEHGAIGSDTLFQGAANLLPSCLLNPETTSVRIIYDDLEYQSEEFEECAYTQSAEIPDGQATLGTIEAHYTRKPPFAERDGGLLKRYAAQLGAVVKLQRAEHTLRDRFRELNYLFDISDIACLPGASLGDIAQGIVDLIPSSWQYPSITCARIHIDDKDYRTPNFTETEWMLSRDIYAEDEPAGFIQVCLLVEMPDAGVGPFLPEEKSVLNVICDRLGEHLRRMRAEEGLRLAHEELEIRVVQRTAEVAVFQSVIQHSIDGIALTNLDGQVTYANPAWCRMLGYEPGSCEVNAPLEVFWSAHDRRALTEKALPAARSGGWRGEAHFLRIDGDTINVSVTFFPLRNQEDEVVGLGMSIQDMTLFKNAMEEIEALRGILPICANCKKIRDDQGYWEEVEVYIHEHSAAEFTHGLCPGCIRELYPELADRALEQ
jgi:PAS domain S-box-containing protein